MKNTAIKKFALMIMFVISFSFVLTGCTLFEDNLAKVYNQVVVEIEYPDGDVLEINRKDLITAFNNYGASLVTESNYSVEDAMDATITALVNQRVLIKYSDGVVEFTNEDKNTLWDDTLKSLEDNIESFKNDVVSDWDITLPTVEKAEDSEDPVVFKPFEAAYEVVLEDGQYVIKRKNDTTQEDEDLEVAEMANVEAFETITAKLYEVLMLPTVFEAEGETLTDLEKVERNQARVYEESVNRYIKILLTNEEGLNLSTNEQEVFEREILRIYENKLDSLKVSKVKEVVDEETTYSRITASDVLNKYEQMLAESIQKYTINPDAFDEDVLSSFEDVNYTDTEDYFFVSHILLKFSDVQQAEYDALEEQYNNGLISAAYYEQRVNELTNQIVAKERDEDGYLVENPTKTSNDVLTEIQIALANAVTDEQKAQVFNDYLYRYNEDEGISNAEYMYVVGTENSKMVETFTEASRELYNDGNGEFGSISGLVPSQYGVHIVFYGGPVSNNSPIYVNSIEDINLTNSDLLTLAQTSINPFNTRTLFDKIFNKLSAQDISANEAMFVNELKKDLTITKHVSRYDDLLG